MKGIQKSKESAKVEVIAQTEADGIIGGHYFLQPDYHDGIKGIFKTSIVEVYEIY